MKRSILSPFSIIFGVLLFISVSVSAQVVVNTVNYSPQNSPPFTLTASGTVPPCGASTGTLHLNMLTSSLPVGTVYTIVAKSSIGNSFSQTNTITTVSNNQLISQTYNGLAGSVSGVLYTFTLTTPKIPPAQNDSSYVAVITAYVYSTKNFQAQVIPVNPKCPVPPNKGSACASALSGTAPYTYAWSNISPNPGNVTCVSNLDTSSFYSVYVKDANGCDTTMPFKISIINPTVSLTSNPGAPICDPVLPVTITWTATPAPGWTLNPGGSFSWNGGVSWTNQATDPASQIANTYGVYTQSVIFRDINNCQANATLPVPVDKRPVFTATANPTSVCPGLSSVVTANLTTCSGISGASCSYSFDGGATYLFPNSNVYTTPAINQDTIIVVRVTNTSGCFRNVNVQIDTAGKPKLTVVVPTICPNAPYTINASCTANCAGVQLNFNGGGFIAGSPQSYTQPTAPLVASTTTFTLSAMGANNCRTDTTVTVVVYNNTLAITKPADTTACANNNGSTVTLTATGFQPATTITWSTNPAGLAGDGSTSNPIQAASPTSGNVTYTVTGTDTHGCYPRTATQSLVIKPQPTVIESGPAVNCEGTSSTLVASGGVSYNWYNASYSTLLSSPGSTYVVSPLVTTTYNVIGTDANGCKDTATYVLPFHNRPTGTVSLFPTTICSGNTTTVSLNANAPFTPNAGGGYSDNDGTTYTDNSTTGPSIVTFPNVGPFSNTTVINTKLRDNFGCISLSIPVTVTVSVFNFKATVTNPSCSYSTNGGISISNLIGGTSPNANYSLNGGTTVPFTTSTTISNLPSNTYALHVTDNSSPACSHDTTLKIAVPSPLTIDTISSNDVICKGDANGSIPVNVTGGTANFTYYLNTISGTPAIASTSNRTPIYTGLSANSYNVIVVDAGGCSDTVTNVPINEPAIALTAPSITPPSFCYGTSTGVFTMSPAATGGWGGYSYTFNGTSIAFGGTKSGLGAGSYPLVTTDTKGCSTSTTIVFTSSPQLFANASTIQSNCDVQGSILFAASTGGTPAYQYSLDNSSFSTSVPTNMTNQSVNTTATLYVKDAQGCTKDTMVTVLNMPRAIPIISVIPPGCPGGSDGAVVIDSIHVKIAGGAPYVLNLFSDKTPKVSVGSTAPVPANTSDTISSLLGGNYILNMTETGTSPGFTPCPNFVVDSFRVYTSPTTYTVVKTPAKFNTGYAEIVVPQPAGFITSSIALASDIHESTGTAILYNLKGGTPFTGPGYQMSIDNPSGLLPITLKDTLGGQTYVSFTNLSSGLHSIYIRDKKGCLDSIKIEVPGKFFIPNLVSPNGDTHNDVFEVISLPDNSNLTITNRWGDRVYESSNYNNQYGFDGLSDGIYYYELKFNTGTRFKGWVQVLR
jgi:hypothetical protein